MAADNEQKPDRLNAYLDAEGRVTRWPTRKGTFADQELVLAYLATKFEAGKVYTEREVNDVLRQYHTFEDWALLRRELFERGYLNREKNGSLYWRTEQTKLY
ncbi:MAG: DUF2087 domain-containing protein [bacterium]|nr:DUF2087 domain-containing protein [bacterium]